jgi:hypothetical protein
MLHSGLHYAALESFAVITMMFMAPVVLLKSLDQNQKTGHASQFSCAFGAHTINGGVIGCLTNQ